MVEEIITALSRFKWLFVIARNSSFTFKGKAVDVKEVGRRLGVRYVLEGSVRKASGKVRITGQLIEAVTGGHIWADICASSTDKQMTSSSCQFCLTGAEAMTHLVRTGTASTTFDNLSRSVSSLTPISRPDALGSSR